MFKHNKIAYYYLQASVFGMGGGGGFGYPSIECEQQKNKKGLRRKSSGILSIFLIAKGIHFYSFLELASTHTPPPPPLGIPGHTPDLVSVIPLADR